MYSIGQKVMLTKLIGSDKEYGYKFGDIITIKDIILRHKYPYKDDKGHPFAIDQLAPVFEIGDTVEIITHPFIKDIKEGKITHIGWVGLYGTDTSIWINGMENTAKGGYWLGEGQVKLIRKGAGMAKSLRDRIEALTGSSTLKEADDILDEITKDREYPGHYGVYLVVNNQHSTIEIIRDKSASHWDMDDDKVFPFNSQCSKLRAFKDALLFLLDKSGLEKDTEKEELLKQIAELKAHHEAEGQRIEELEERINKTSKEKT